MTKYDPIKLIPELIKRYGVQYEYLVKKGLIDYEGRPIFPPEPLED